MEANSLADLSSKIGYLFGLWELIIITSEKPSCIIIVKTNGDIYYPKGQKFPEIYQTNTRSGTGTRNQSQTPYT